MRISYILVVIFLIIAVFIIAFLSYVSPLEKKDFILQTSNDPQASLSFVQSVISPQSTEVIESEVLLQSNVPVKSAQIDLSYDPNVIYNFNIAPSENNFFGDKNSYKVTLLEVRENMGRATFSIETLPDSTDKMGKGPISKITFKTNLLTAGETKIEFLNKSTVIAKNSRESILKNTTPLRIFFKNMSMPTTQQTPNPALLEN